MIDRPRSSRPPARRVLGATPAAGRVPRLVTPVRASLGVALLGSTVFVAWGLTARDATQIPTLAVGFLVYGLVFAALAFAGAAATYRAARADEAGRAFTFALLGGIAGLISAGSFALAVVFALVLGWS